ncbi:MAG TPA: site-2 protease family protein [Pilimelia sp.]|nr:site-2 protease family protein [Pilimelia sp.]
MAYVLGVALFALAILVSVSLHEAGHMGTAKAFGMKVTRFFVGFGPTLWSFRRGDTEYGIKGIPLGGFVKIVGMTPQDEDVKPGDEARAMWRYPVWKRTVVMSAGSAVHFLLALTAAWIAAMTMGLPNQALAEPQPAYVRVVDCVIVAPEARECRPGDPAAPAKAAGLRDSDRIVAINGVAIGTYEDLLREMRKVPPGRADITYERAGARATVRVDLATVERPPLEQPEGPPTKVAALGVAPTLPPGVQPWLTYGPVEAVPATFSFAGDLAVRTFEAIKRFPERVPALWNSIFGAERDPDTPISVIGASRLGGEAVEHNAWEIFVLLFISLNFFVGVFNLLPLLPLDGGHIAVIWFEKARSWLFARLGRADPGRVDYAKLMPVTYVVILVFGAFTLLTASADIVNPITIFGR